MINHGCRPAPSSFSSGVIYERRHTRMIAEYGGSRSSDAGLRDDLPDHHDVVDRTARVLNGFIGEFTILVGVFNRSLGGGRFSASLGIVLGAAYMLWMYQRVFFGPLDQSGERESRRTWAAESLIYILPIVILLCFWIGLYPKPLL